MDRSRALKNMSEQTFDLAIVGGGITGAGVARDAASRGMKVALIEANDFASGTSSRSSKLIHGGIRYLENFEFGLVFEALSERARLFEMAPHLVHPLRFLIPVYDTGRVPAWKMGLGMWAYDALSLWEAPEVHQHLDAREAIQAFPQLRSAGLDRAFTYPDAYMDDDRLVHETLRSAVAFGAQIANFTRATTVRREGEKLTALTCEDLETGHVFDIRARHFVGSVGPWTDRLGEMAIPKWRPKLRPSKGVHLTFLAERFPLDYAVVMGAEKRIVFAIPRHGMVIVGTTDTDYPGDPSRVRAEADDVEYLLGVIGDYFPGAQITARDIVGCYAGVRPLIDDGAQSESKTSREHEIWTVGENLTFVAGGKYTTYRRMAEQTVEESLRYFTLEERAAFRKSQTLAPLNPLITPASLESAIRGAERPDRPWGNVELALARRHGPEGRRIMRLALEAGFDSGQDSETLLWMAEALHAVDETMCRRLVDFYTRRSPLILSRADHGKKFVGAVADVMGARLGWSSERRQNEINALQNQVEWDLAAILSV